MATITKRSNTYRIRVSCGYDVTGKQVMKSMTWQPDPSKTQRQNDKALLEEAVLFEKRVKDGLFLDGSIKFACFAEKWIAEYAEKQLEPKTLFSYKQMLVRINEAIGHIRLDKLQPHHLLEFYSNLQEEGVREDIKYETLPAYADRFLETGLTKTKFAELAGVSISVVNSCSAGKHISKNSAKKVSEALGVEAKKLFQPVKNSGVLSNRTILYYHRVISSILSTAVHWQIIYSNPAQRVKPPKAEHKEAKYLDDVQARQVLALLANEPIKYRTGIALLIYSGLRRGELCGLEWPDVDFRNNTITVRRASQYLPGKGVFDKSPKNESSNRTIKLPPEIFNLLNQYKVWQTEERLKAGELWENSNRLFTSWNGNPMHPDTLTDWFSQFVTKNRLPDVSIHSLRHTNATLLISGGIPLRVVADMLGHSQPTLTANLYSHAIQAAKAAAADTLEDMLHPVKMKQG